LRRRKARNLQRVAMEIREIACTCREPKAQAPEDEEMEIRHGEMVSCNPLSVRQVPLYVSEVIGQLRRCRTLDRTLASYVVAKTLRTPEPSQGRMHRGLAAPSQASGRDPVD
jgi:hypothetical protein